MPSHASTLAHQGRTETTATSHREPWAEVEVDLVVQTRDVPAVEVAEALGRTLYAIQFARYRLDHGMPLGGGNEPVQPAASRRQPRAYTFIGDDVPPGWND